VRRALAALLLALAGLVGLVGACSWWLDQPLSLSAPAVDLSIEPGTSARGVADAVAQSGVQVRADWLYAWFRLSGQDRQIKAGSYEIETGTTPRSLLRKLVRGEESLRTVTLVEGWTFRQVRQALAQAPQLAADTAALSDEAIMERLGRAGLPAEGRFFPDTYSYAKGSSDLKVLARALRSMDRHLADVWDKRAPDTPLKNPDQALVLGSIVEKETGRASERPQIAGVFANRLRIGMLLQTDPTVIYGMGDLFDGNLRKKDLQTDTPWNTYTRAGLPPTPIAMPGRDALLAAVAPARTDALYFVARGDGSSEFSSSLDAHNRAVDKYQRKR
jgi:UPF0755 protein